VLRCAREKSEGCGHSLRKRGKATPQQDIDLIDKRLKRAAELHAATMKESRT
jgi:hypothetical protein